MQTLSQIRQILKDHGLAPHKRLGQNFLVDHNLMARLLDLAALAGTETVLEVGPGTGSLTEELLDRAGRVVAVEIDRGFHELLTDRLGDRENLTLLHADVLAGKHEIAPQVRDALAPQAHMVANLPYSIATPLLAECLLLSWASQAGQHPGQPVRLDRLTFTLQKEVADRLAAAPGSGAYGPVSVVASLLAKITPGPAVPNSAFWPRPKVASRILRIDFDPDAAARLRSADQLTTVLATAFGHRRKQILAAARQRGHKIPPDSFAAALREARIDPTARAEDIPPLQYLRLANALSAPGADKD